MSDDKEVTFTMKVMINKQKTKVVFAEIDNDLADFVKLPDSATGEDCASSEETLWR